MISRSYHQIVSHLQTRDKSPAVDNCEAKEAIRGISQIPLAGGAISFGRRKTILSFSRLKIAAHQLTMDVDLSIATLARVSRETGAIAPQEKEAL